VTGLIFVINKTKASIICCDMVFVENVDTTTKASTSATASTTKASTAATPTPTTASTTAATTTLTTAPIITTTNG
jgi:hypothetical protein